MYREDHEYGRLRDVAEGEGDFTRDMDDEENPRFRRERSADDD